MKGTLTIIAFTMVLAGCGNNITGTNTDLNGAHVSTAAKTPDCTASGCHPGIGAAGTVFENLSSTNTVSGITVKARSASTLAEITLGISNSLGNFNYNSTLSGDYNMTTGNKPWSGAHPMPGWNGCNQCHNWHPLGGAKGKLN